MKSDRSRALVCLVIVLGMVVGCVLISKWLNGDYRDPEKTKSYVIREFIEGDLGLDIAGGVFVECYDDHGGWMGEGETYAVIQFPDQRLAEDIMDRNGWQPMPISRDMHLLVYGWAEDGTKVNGWFDRRNLPEIEHGYWILLDRQSDEQRASRPREDEEPGILNRYSWNLTIGLYDTDQDILYVLALDT